MRITTGDNERSAEIAAQVRLLGHAGFGVTELRVFDPTPLVAYADNEGDLVDLVHQMPGNASGIYIGVQPRPPHLFDQAPNCWRPAGSGIKGNCARDTDIEVITALFFDLDAVSDQRHRGHPACPDELARTLEAAMLLSQQNGLALASTLCCSGNGHYVLTPILPILVSDDQDALRFKSLCSQLVRGMPRHLAGVRIDPVYNLSRVMRVMGTLNRKGRPLPDRPHRCAHFVSEPIWARSVALHHMLLNAEILGGPSSAETLPDRIRCNLDKIERCAFIRWCRQHPTSVSEPLWFALITNLARLEGGAQRAHDISRLDAGRYDCGRTQRLIERVARRGYGPTSCFTLKTLGFHCRRLQRCPARAPMYLTDLFSIWKG